MKDSHLEFSAALSPIRSEMEYPTVAKFEPLTEITNEPVFAPFFCEIANCFAASIVKVSVVVPTPTPPVTIWPLEANTPAETLHDKNEDDSHTVASPCTSVRKHFSDAT